MSAPISSSAQRRAFALPRLVLTDGTVEAMKWLALILMTVDHVNKYLLHDRFTAAFDVGRLAMPLFAFVLAYNLSRPGTLARGVYGRTAKRLTLTGTVATVPFVALGGLLFHWWPLNILAMMLLACSIMFLIETGGKLRCATAIVLFIVGGGFVEFWWPALLMCLAAWRYCKSPSWTALVVWVAATVALYAINRNMWALGAFGIIFGAPHVRLPVGRLRYAFYAYYPAHLAALWVLSRYAGLGFLPS